MHNTVSKLAQSDRRYAGDTVRILEVDPVVFNDDRRVIRARFDQLSVEILDESGSAIGATVATADSAFAISLRFSQNRWVVTKVQTIQS
jgi:hypothetical protein